jgi:hypothetical protein
MSPPWDDIVVAEEVGAGVAAGAGVDAGAAEGVAAGAEADGAVVGDALAAEAAGTGLALGVVCDEQPVTAPRAAAAKAAGTATRPSMERIRGMRGARRVVARVAVVFMSCSLRVTAVTGIGVARDSRANNFSAQIPGSFSGAAPQGRRALGRCRRIGTSRARKTW